MKKKTLITLLIATSTTLTVSLSFAATSKMMRLLSQMMGSSGAPVLKITTITPNNTKIMLDEVRLFEGATCSTLVNVVDFYSTQNENILVDSEQDDLLSGDLFEMLGPNAGCFEVDSVYHGKVISTGLIKLTWKSGQYVTAHPNSVIMKY